MKICALILAAGGSSRLGRPKQLVKAGNQTLIERAITSAVEAGLEPVYVVLGARFEQINPAVEQLPVKVIMNEQWKEGIGGSISAGLEAINAAADYDGILIMLSDQLHVNSGHLKALVNAFGKENKRIIATGYAEKPGVPAAFGRKYFPLLRNLSGDEGAKKIISHHPEDVHSVLFEQAIIDIDTPEDVEKEGLS